MTMSQQRRAAGAVESDPRWVAVTARSAAADGSFFYSVRTTGVYCRPSCGSRLPRPENVRFHPTREEAERAGFRPLRGEAELLDGDDSGRVVLLVATVRHFQVT